MRTAVVLTSTLLLLSACSSLPEWWGDQEESVVSGDRISVLKSKSKVTADYILDGIDVVLPPVKENTRWYKSSGFHVLTAPNPDVAEDLSEYSTSDIGKGGEKNEHLTASPIIAGDSLFVIDGVGSVSAYSALNVKKRLWKSTSLSKKNKYRTGQSGLSYHRGRLYATTGSNEVVALQASDGKELWRRSINSITRAAPAVSGNKIFVNTVNNRLYALDADDGSILWTHSGVGEDISIYGSASPVSVSDVVLVPYSSGEIYALRASDGREVWSDSLALEHSSATSTFVDIEASPVVSGNRVIAASGGGVLASIELFSGAPLWEKEIPTTRTPWISGDFVFIVSEEQQLICQHMNSGRVKWVVDLPGYKNVEKKKGAIRWTAPVVAGGRILVVNNVGKMLDLSSENGEVVREYKVIKDVYITPVVAHGRVYLLNNEGDLVSYFSEDASS